MTSKPSSPKHVGKKLRAYFVAGLLTLIPVALTVYVVWQLFIGLDSLLNKPVSRLVERLPGLEGQVTTLPGLGLLALILLILLVGFVARNVIGRRLIQVGDWIVGRIPVVRHIYTTFQQISHAFLADQSEVFKQAALIEYPRKGIYSIGFITQDTKGTVQDNLPKDVVSIFLPTTPNPTSGYLLFVPKEEVIMLPVTVEEALKLVISGGAIVPERKPPEEIHNMFGIRRPS